jgi:predicted ATPase
VLKHAREINHAASLMFTLTIAAVTPILCGNYAAAKTQLDEVAALADEKGALSWKLWGATHRSWLLALTGGASDAVHAFPKVIADYQSMGATTFLPFYLSCLTSVYAELKQFDDAWRCIGEAMTTLETTKQRWCEAEIFRIAGETMIKSCCAAKAEPYLTRALAVSREQQAKSWELRSAMSIARLWRSQGKVQQARELLAPVYGWFTEGFDTLDLKEAKALLEQLKP